MQESGSFPAALGYHAVLLIDAPHQTKSSKAVAMPQAARPF
jgi:hypothetical protein